MRILLLAVSVALATLAYADVEVAKDEAQSIKVFDLQELERSGSKVDGMLAKIRFTSRNRSFTTKADGSIQGRLSLWKPMNNVGDFQPKYGSIEVVVPKEGAEWFMRLKTDDSRTQQSVYARLNYTGSQVTARLVGKELKTDFKGSKLIW